MTTSSSLPFELVLHILDSLNDQPKTIQSCALVCHAWRAQSQAHAFRTITLKTLKQCNNLLIRLAESPHIALLIRDISFSFETRDEAFPINTILHSLKHIRSLSLCGGTKDYAKAKTATPLIEALASAIARPSFVSLKLYTFALSFYELQSLFRYASSLKHLSLIGVSCQSHEGLPFEDVVRMAAYPEQLILDMKNNTVIGKWMCEPHCSVKLTHLRSLGIDYRAGDNDRELSIILKQAATSLESLHIRRKKARAFCDGLFLDVSHNHNLRSLRLDLAPKVRYAASLCPPKCVLSTLDYLSRPVPIQELIIHIGIIDSESFLGTNHSGWRQLATLLSLDSFPSLRSVKVVLKDCITHVQLLEEMVKREMQDAGLIWSFEMVVYDGASSIF